MRRLAWTLCLGGALSLQAQAQEVKKAPEGPLATLLNKAETCLGAPYRYGGSTLRGFDCSGFVRFVFGSVGIDLDRSSAAQAKQGEAVPLNQIQPGDLLFFRNTRGLRKGISHVGIYLGEGQFIHASSWSGRGTHCVKLAGLASDYFVNRLVAARRVVTQINGVTEVPKEFLSKVFKEQDQDPSGTLDPNVLESAPPGLAHRP